ncbi:probable G-protein coupled receptor 82 isoform X1 [Carcharodon carcharias]|uniref:probable G-protein coupled receptor 82 isoform X1 n=1 Tax=Carcharodon carcharias TaxID=13397 RepID=UPI001B7EA78D|nr:probable G-protein coupled receptor 82 isoform X1 [Carcharodon carcharias]
MATEINKLMNTLVNLTNISQECNLTAGRLERVVLPILYSVIIFVGVPANFMALWMLLQHDRKHGILIYLMNLAMADLISCLALPFRAALLLMGDTWKESSPTCTIVMIIINFSFYYTVSCSTIFLAFISISRYAMIVKPNNRQLNKFYDTSFARLACAITWITTAIPLLSLNINYFIKEVNFNNVDSVCYNMQLQYGKAVSANAFVTVAVMFLIILAMFAFSYASIALHLCTVRRKRISQHNRVIHIRAQMIIIAAMTGFIVCHLPYHIYQIVTGLLRLKSDNCHHLLETHPVKLITLWFVSLSSCLNPILYFLLSKSFVENRSRRRTTSKKKLTSEITS